MALFRSQSYVKSALKSALKNGFCSLQSFSGILGLAWFLMALGTPMTPFRSTKKLKKALRNAGSMPANSSS